MRLHEVFAPIPPIEEVLEEDFRSVRDRMLGAAVAGSMAMGIGAAGSAMNHAKQDAGSSVSYELPDADDTDDTTAAKGMSQDEKFLALTIWGEARNGGKDGMRAVAHVILNRMNSKRDFGDSVREVVRNRKAFSCWNRGDPNRDLMMNIGKLDKHGEDYKMWKAAQKIAKKVMRGHDKDPTHGSLFYHTAGVDPSWNDGQNPVAKIAGHLFYKNDAKA
jgi:spore germination cell wall hydrolase CwlJ-like protein